MQPVALKRVIISFWSLYFAAVWVTNLLDAARTVGLLPAEWAYASGNLALITGAVTKIGLPAGMGPPRSPSMTPSVSRSASGLAF